MGYWDVLIPSFVIALVAIAVLPWVEGTHMATRIIAFSICIALSWRYMSWRLTQTIPFNGDWVDLMTGMIFVGVELLTLVGTTISAVVLMRTRSRTGEVEKNLGWLRALPEAPQVDVLICTYNEEEAILERTIIGALAMDYPRHRVWVCDDGRRDWLRALSEKYGVGYLTRSDNAHAKAGNINAALAVLAELPEPPEFVSILDADFVPMPTFLERTVALMRDQNVGVVQTPQHFFNQDPIQSNLSLTNVFPDEQRFFFDIVMPSKDAWGGAFCCGTSSLIRFDALMAIGGFPTDSVTEDYLVTVRLREQGYATVYLNEILSLGLAPEGLAEYTGQRGRWCLGLTQICRGKSGPLSVTSALPPIHRLMLIEAFLYWFGTHAFRLAAFIVPVLYLLFDVQAVDADMLDAIDHILPMFIAQVFIFWWITEGRVVPIIADLYQLLCAHEALKAVWAGLTNPTGRNSRSRRRAATAAGSRSSGNSCACISA